MGEYKWQVAAAAGADWPHFKQKHFQKGAEWEEEGGGGEEEGKLLGSTGENTMWFFFFLSMPRMNRNK